MIEEPYRWVEAIANRREYIEDQLRRGRPARRAELRGRPAAVDGQPRDAQGFRGLRPGCLRGAGSSRRYRADAARRHRPCAHRGIQPRGSGRIPAAAGQFRTEPRLKTAFEEVFSAPYIVKILLGGLGDDRSRTPLSSSTTTVPSARSEIETKEPFDVLAGTREAQKAMLDYLVEHDGNPRRSLEDALKLAAKTWAVGMDMAETGAG